MRECNLTPRPVRQFVCKIGPGFQDVAVVEVHLLNASVCFSVVWVSIFTATVCTRHVALYT